MDGYVVVKEDKKGRRWCYVNSWYVEEGVGLPNVYRKLGNAMNRAYSEFVIEARFSPRRFVAVYVAAWIDGKIEHPVAGTLREITDKALATRPGAAGEKE